MTNIYGAKMMYGALSPVAPMTGTTTTAAEIMLPMYGTADSGLTYAHLPVVSRKRSREDSNNSINMNNQMLSYPHAYRNPNIYAGNSHSSAGEFTFLGQDFSSQVQYQQLELDTFITQHMEKVRLEIEDRRKTYFRRIMEAMEGRILKKLKLKEDEIEEIVKLNCALEERVKSLAVENQIWRDLAQTNEATANVLRNNLEQVLAHVENDAQSCCGSTVEDNGVEESSCRRDSAGNSHDKGSMRICRRCGKDEACVLLLPCRHLCLCSVCGSSQNVCPICKSTKSCSLHVNLTS